MPLQNKTSFAWNRGIMSRLGLARSDIERYALSAEISVNWMPRVLGSMMLRPGWQYIGATQDNNPAYTLPFIYATDDTAHLEFTDNVLRVRVNDALITRAAVTAVVTNGTFTTDLSGWTVSDEAGAASTWVAPGQLSLVGTGVNNAILDQQVTVHQAGVEHALRVIIPRGDVVFSVGSAQGLDDFLAEGATTLGTGTHSLAFTPTGGSFWIRFENVNVPAALVDSCVIEAAGIMQLPTPFAGTNLPYIRSTESADVIYIACNGLVQQQKVERRSTTSWSIVLYEPVDGPFMLINTTAITIGASAIQGDITLTASKSIFKTGHVGALFRIASTGQLVEASISGDDQWTDPIEVVGIGAQRTFQFSLTGTYVGTVTLQYSVEAPGSWVDVGTKTGTGSYNDAQDNQIIFYRIGIKSGDYTSGTLIASLSFASGSINGIVKVTGYTSGTSVAARVLKSLGGTGSSENWWEGQWSTFRGWPSAVVFFEGRLWWLGNNKMNGSVSDTYESFDDSVVGDSGPVSRSIGEGPVDTINWALPLLQLEMGTGGNEYSVRSSTFSDPITPTNFYMHPIGSQGSAAIDAVKIDIKGVFVQRGGARVFELDLNIYTMDYASTELTIMVPDLNEVGITKIAVQRQPDTRVHCVRADGTVAVMIYDRGENIICWIEVETTGFVEDVSVIPGQGEDQVYYVVRRVINGQTVRYVEKWATEASCQGLPEARLSDAHLIYAGAATTTISGLDYLDGETVVVWGWNTIAPFTTPAFTKEGSNILTTGHAVGLDMGTYVVSNGQITGLPEAVTNACVGLPYTAQFKSMKQAFAVAMGTAINQTKRIGQLGLVLINSHSQGLLAGSSFDNLESAIPLDDLPVIPDEEDDAGNPVPDTDVVFIDYDRNMSHFDDVIGTDSRLCLQAASPRPCTLVAATIEMVTNG